MKQYAIVLAAILACSLIPLELSQSQSQDSLQTRNESINAASARSNNPPTITSIDLHNIGDLYVGQEEPLNMTVHASDVDDPTGDSLEYSWSHAGSSLAGCGGFGDSGSYCSTPLLESYFGYVAVVVTVTDEENESVSEELMLQIWNDGTTDATTDSGMTLEYSMLYWGTYPFSITATDGAAVFGETLPGYTGTYDSVGVIDYSPSTTYSANDVLTQSLNVQFDKSTGATSLWYVNGATWTLIADASTDVDATTGMFSFTFPPNSPVLSTGKMVLMGGALNAGDVPYASITGFNAAAGKAGAILLNWNFEGTILSGDSIDVTICEAVNCITAFETGLGVGTTSYTYSGQNTVHGVNYEITVAVCNEFGCSSPVGTGSVIADSTVDGGAEATDLTIAAAGTTWTVSWTASGDQGDVASWKVCYNRGTFTAAQIDELTCILDVSGTSVNVDTSTWSAGTYTYYFTAVPVDALGNSVAAGAMNSIEYQRDSDNSNVDDGSEVIEDSLDSDGDGVADDIDLFPNDSNESIDTDNDGMGDNSDAFPEDANETHDDDGDGVGNNTDAFPQDENETMDTDSDGVGDNQDPEPTNPDVTSIQDISVEISDTSSYIIAGSIAFLAIVILFVRRKQPPQPHINSHHVANDSMWNDD